MCSIYFANLAVAGLPEIRLLFPARARARKGKAPPLSQDSDELGLLVIPTICVLAGYIP
jgi:hypothetical protein